MITKENLYRLIDQLPNSELDAARRYLEYLRDTSDPVLRAFLNAPEDDEETTDEDMQAIEEAMEDVRSGDVVPLDEVKRDLGYGASNDRARR